MRRTPGARVIGLTGSSGKTTTKDLIAALLEPAGPTIAPPGSYNNDLGVPLTVLRADAGDPLPGAGDGCPGPRPHRPAVLDRPASIGVVLNVGTAHLGEFGSRQAIAESKGELVEAARDVAVLNADDPLVAAMAGRAPGPGGDLRRESPTPMCARAVSAIDPAGRAGFTLETPAGSAAVQLALVGGHHVVNALAARRSRWSADAPPSRSPTA